MKSRMMMIKNSALIKLLKVSLKKIIPYALLHFLRLVLHLNYSRKYINSGASNCFFPSSLYEDEELIEHSDNPEVKCIALYLPQYHPIEENDKSWGRGFTEWSNVTRALPQFEGHYQPHFPADLGFYDLRLDEIYLSQSAMARRHGVSGFCIYHYWFDGKEVLDHLLKRIAAEPSMDMPFCICWANENWTRRWDGSEQSVILRQSHTLESDKSYIHDVTHLLRDPRYLRVDGRPMLIVYRADLLSNAPVVAEYWRSVCKSEGIGEIYLVCVQSFGITDPHQFGFDAALEFPPHSLKVKDKTFVTPRINPVFTGAVHSYEDVVCEKMAERVTEYHRIRCIMPSWDNSARTQLRARIFYGSTPSLFQKWAQHVVNELNEDQSVTDKFFFVNAWNEWAEGAHLEPDRHYGYAYLNALSRALRSK